MAATSGWNRKWSKGLGALLVLFQCVMIGFIVGEIVLSRQQMDMVVGQHDKNSETSSYRRHYALIMEQPEEQSREEIFEGCLEEGKETGAYVELMGEGLDGDYSRIELARIAIAAQVDGI
ncbi:MAG TPA: hypothetical protein PK462_01135, partial [Lachnospira sp.]|nr:hypothetical protein [Lachnospira sp.]